MRFYMLACLFWRVISFWYHLTYIAQVSKRQTAGIQVVSGLLERLIYALFC